MGNLLAKTGCPTGGQKVAHRLLVKMKALHAAKRLCVSGQFRCAFASGGCSEKKRERDKVGEVDWGPSELSGAMLAIVVTSHNGGFPKTPLGMILLLVLFPTIKVGAQCQAAENDDTDGHSQPASRKD